MKKNNVCGNSEGGHTNQVLVVCFATITIVITCYSPVKSLIGVTSVFLANSMIGMGIYYKLHTSYLELNVFQFIYKLKSLEKSKSSL